MPVFARRRLQAMLVDLAALTSKEKCHDLLRRLEHKNAKDALAAEVELSLLWAISKVAHLEIDPELPNTASRPDALSNNIFLNAPAIIEITAISDDAFSGKTDMERVADIISHFCNRIRKGVGSHLYFEFLEGKSRENGKIRRVRRVSSKFELTKEFETNLKDWVNAYDWPKIPIRLTDDTVDVVIQWKENVHPHGRTFSSMPAVADDIEDNPVFKSLQRKERQVSRTPEGTLKCIFLGDAGCRMLRELTPFGPFEVSGDQVIRHFLSRSTIDIVCVFSPHRQQWQALSADRRAPRWKATLYERNPTPDRDKTYARLNKMVGDMPWPKLEGYQARSWHQQGMFDPQGMGNYLGTKMTTKLGSLSISVSSRLVLELLAGRITEEQFRNFAFGRDHNHFERYLKSGMTIQSARLEKSGIDEDDDDLVLDLEPDWGAKPLVNPKA
ncbi:hypothetical protein SAMN03159423_5011 [Bradyrhizobium sp. NFR13]|uniref:hypothetical protein n=1 Tax=Bradyrhizobium sp. NFR13 TaxID=1566285 RepID=UPI0008EF62F3|nr:hypothetical protein [Bradyrhizobium sp. NFR13]SFM04134.1 hypothetical protein SAMN03159423_5011 [Bradyrhizobium sp. NFR13]